MQVTIFILGVFAAVAGLVLLFQETASKRKSGFVCLLVAAVFFVLGGNLKSVRKVELSEQSVAITFVQEPSANVLSHRQQTSREQEAKQKWQKMVVAADGFFRKPQQPAPEVGEIYPQKQQATPNQTATDVLHLSPFMVEMDELYRTLQDRGYIPATDPRTDLRPGTIVSKMPDGELKVFIKQEDAFPGLRIESSPFDLPPVTMMKQYSLFCGDGFRESLPTRPYVTTPDAGLRLKEISSPYVVFSVVGCDGTIMSPSGKSTWSSRYVLGFTLSKPIVRR